MTTKSNPGEQETGELKCRRSETVRGIGGAYPCRLPRDHQGEHDCTPEVIRAPEAERDTLRKALSGMIARAEALDSLLVAYRLGRSPTAKTFRELEQTEDAVAAARAALGETK
jgi:hypothetical protein